MTRLKAIIPCLTIGMMGFFLSSVMAQSPGQGTKHEGQNISASAVSSAGTGLFTKIKSCLGTDTAAEDAAYTAFVNAVQQGKPIMSSHIAFAQWASKRLLNICGPDTMTTCKASLPASLTGETWPAGFTVYQFSYGNRDFNVNNFAGQPISATDVNNITVANNSILCSPACQGTVDPHGAQCPLPPNVTPTKDIPYSLVSSCSVGGICQETCVAPYVLSGGVCTCTPISSCPANSCGSISDGCSGLINCGGCSTGNVCSNNQCVPACINPIANASICSANPYPGVQSNYQLGPNCDGSTTCEETCNTGYAMSGGVCVAVPLPYNCCQTLSGGSWTVPASLAAAPAQAYVWGAGGGGGGGGSGNNSYDGGGGGGGEMTVANNFTITTDQKYTVTIGSGGSGGAGGSGQGTNGNNGGASSFIGNGVFVNALGGTGGAPANWTNGGPGGTCSLGGCTCTGATCVNFDGGAGGNVNGNNSGGCGGGGGGGGGAGGTADTLSATPPGCFASSNGSGSSLYGGGTGGSGYNNNGTGGFGRVPGGGGGGVGSGNTGGVGGDGQVKICVSYGSALAGWSCVGPQTAACAAAPANALFWGNNSSSYTYTQNCTSPIPGNCLAWSPPNTTTTYSATDDPNNACDFYCASGYFWNGSSCTLCGNGTVDSGEQCDNGANNGTGTSFACSTSCQWTTQTVACPAFPANSTHNGTTTYTSTCNGTAVDGKSCSSWITVLDRYSTTPGTCTFVCQSGYVYSNGACVASGACNGAGGPYAWHATQSGTCGPDGWDCFPGGLVCQALYWNITCLDTGHGSTVVNDACCTGTPPASETSCGSCIHEQCP